MTSTCDRCNNKLGSLIDKPLVDSMFGRFASFKLSTEESNGVPGFRTYRNVRIARGEGHERAIWLDGEKNAKHHELLAGAGAFQAKIRLPDPKAVYLGELKNLYLAGCVIAGEILSGPTSERVREDLVAIRDNPALLEDRDTFDVTTWIRHTDPFTAEVRRPDSLPIYEAVVERNDRLIPAIAWRNYTCEEPFPDSPALTARLNEARQFLKERRSA